MEINIFILKKKNNLLNYNYKVNLYLGVIIINQLLK